jgi:hypothetical protein
MSLDLSIYTRADLEAICRNQMRFIAYQQDRLNAQAIEIADLGNEIAKRDVILIQLNQRLASILAMAKQS